LLVAGDQGSALYEFAIRSKQSGSGSWRPRDGGVRCQRRLQIERTAKNMNKATRALVTGGSGGIGSAICRRLGVAGHFVYVHAHRSVAGADAIVSEIVTAGGRAAAVHFDLNRRGCDARSNGEIAGDGAVQVLVNNAGIHDDPVIPDEPHAVAPRVDLSRQRILQRDATIGCCP